jgi:hypothetical protein
MSDNTRRRAARGRDAIAYANLFSYGRATSEADRIAAGGARRDRTDDLLLAKQALSQLSYGPALRHPAKAGMVGLGRFELPTSRLSSARSNQLSYRPNYKPERTRARPRTQSYRGQ